VERSTGWHISIDEGSSESVEESIVFVVGNVDDVRSSNAIMASKTGCWADISCLSAARLTGWHVLWENNSSSHPVKITQWEPHEACQTLNVFCTK